jgi:outer membrane protein assembly factor BamD
MKNIALCFTILFLLASCGGKDLTPSESAQADYEKGKSLIDRGDYTNANLFLENFSAEHPYSKYTIPAELLRLFAAYKGKEYILSETLAGRFADMHPRHPDVAYAKYILAMSHFKQVGDQDRDQTQTKLTIEALKRVIKEHPGSNYAKDSAARLQNLNNKLSSHELIVGKYYFDKERYVAAANRFKVVLDNYQTTPAIEEALYYLAASYAKLGIMTTAREMAILLRHNFPKSDWSDKAKEFL